MDNYRLIENRGLIVPDTATIRACVEAEFRAVFGEDMPTDPATPQGMLITRITEERDAIARNNAELANQINPAIAGGVFLDSLIALTGSRRRSAVRSLIAGAQFGGVPGTIISAGSLATVEPSGEQFAVVADVILGQAGTGVGDLRAVNAGPVAASAGSLNAVASSVLGWETIFNPAAAVLGKDKEKDVPLRRRRRQTLARQTTSINEAIVSRLYDLPGVRSLSYLENYSDTGQVMDGIFLRKHSLWACVEGGTDDGVAQALFETKTVGGGYNGAVIVAVPDPINGRLYEVKFDRPEEVVLLVRVSARASYLDIQQVIPDLVMNYVSGEVEGDAGFVTGSDVSPFEIAGAINQQEPTIFVRRVELSLAGSGTWSSDTFEIARNQVARTRRSSIQVVVE